MSADNGYIIRRNSAGEYVLQMYFASDDDYPPIDDPNGKVFYTLEDAVKAYEDAEPSEYGLRTGLGDRSPRSPGSR